jgi:hypothetical protein
MPPRTPCVASAGSTARASARHATRTGQPRQIAIASAWLNGSSAYMRVVRPRHAASPCQPWSSSTVLTPPPTGSRRRRCARRAWCRARSVERSTTPRHRPDERSRFASSRWPRDGRPGDGSERQAPVSPGHDLGGSGAAPTRSAPRRAVLDGRNRSGSDGVSNQSPCRVSSASIVRFAGNPLRAALANANARRGVRGHGTPPRRSCAILGASRGGPGGPLCDRFRHRPLTG